MLDRAIDDIDEGALVTLVANQVAERRDLEFKRELPGRNDEQVKEFLSDVTSLANAQGGDLIFGIEEENGVAAGLVGVEIVDPDAEILRLESSLQSGVAPRLIGVRSHWVPLAGMRGAIVIRVPASIGAPHRVTFKNSGRFWGRNSRGKYEMDVHELRTAFVQSEQLPQRFRQIHTDAIAAARGVDMPFPVKAVPAAVLTVAPLNLFREGYNIPVDRDQAVVPVGPGGYDSINLIEGVLMHSSVDPAGGTIDSFALTYRSGRVDAAWQCGGEIPGRDGNWKVARPIVFERSLLDMAHAAQVRLLHFGIEGPWVVLASVYGTLGRRLIAGDDYYTAPAFRDQAFLGQHVVEQLDAASLMPIAEAFWLVFGENRPRRIPWGERA